MRHRLVTCMTVLALTILGIGIWAPLDAGQERKPTSSKAWATPRTPWGDPDLQGIWNTSGATPLERPDRYAGRDTLTEEELKSLRAQAANAEDAPPRPGDPGAYNAFWFDRGAPIRQTSLIVDPPDGKLPPLTPEGQAARRARAKHADTWEGLHLWERCITRGGLPNAMLPRAYNNNAQIFQAPGYVVILLEQIHRAFRRQGERPAAVGELWLDERQW